MALPAMITQMGQQQFNYGASVGQSLQQLGQQVGQTLAMQEYQRQAATQLPFISEQMQAAAREASEGKFGDAYGKILGLTSNPQVMQNPFILPALEMGMQAIKQGSSQAWFNLQQEQMQKRGEAGTTALPSLMGMFEGGEFGDMTQDQVGMEAELIDDNQPNFNQSIVEVPLPEQGPVPSAVAAPPQEEEMPPIAGGRLPQPSPQPTPMQKAAESATKKYFSLSPKEQEKMDEETTYNLEELKGNFEVAQVAGLGRFIPGATGVGVPKPITRKEKSLTITNQGRQSLKIDRKTIDEATTKGREFANRLADSVSQLESSPEAMQMISEAGGINKVAARKDRDSFTLKPISGGDEIEIDQPTFEAIDRIKAARAIGAASGMPIVVGRYDFASVEEAEASGLPSGTIVYINGRKARID
jgi:hypothetical protein